MGKPRKLDRLTKVVTVRIRDEQYGWLHVIAERDFEGDMSKAVRWALDHGQTFSWLLNQENPVAELDEMLNPFEAPDPEEEIAQAERELEAWKREQAVKRARSKKGAA
jgi:hypothetical protein